MSNNLRFQNLLSVALATGATLYCAVMMYGVATLNAVA